MAPRTPAVAPGTPTSGTPAAASTAADGLRQKTRATRDPPGPESNDATASKAMSRTTVPSTITSSSPTFAVLPAAALESAAIWSTCMPVPPWCMLSTPPVAALTVRPKGRARTAEMKPREAASSSSETCFATNRFSPRRYLMRFMCRTAMSVTFLFVRFRGTTRNREDQRSRHPLDAVNFAAIFFSHGLGLSPYSSITSDMALMHRKKPRL